MVARRWFPTKNTTKLVKRLFFTGASGTRKAGAAHGHMDKDRPVKFPEEDNVSPTADDAHAMAELILCRTSC